MSSNALSVVLEEQIRRLYLTDFPCGYGSWRKIKDSTDDAGKDETDDLLDLLSCPHSPWWHDVSWSPQAAHLRKLAVLSPECLHSDFIYNYFTTLRIVDKNVSEIDNGLLKFSRLEELVLSANRISQLPAQNLPSTLKILELRANWLSNLNSLTSCPPPHLQYLGLGSNSLGSDEDISNFSSRHWPQLVCLDLSDCDFQDQRTLLNTLSTLPSLKTLVLEGNPFTLAPSYPGFTVDSLPQLSCLDTSWISTEQRHHFSGLAKMRNLIIDRAVATVRVGRLRGIPDPLMAVDENAPDFPVITYSYFITYEFLTHQSPLNLLVNSESKIDMAHMTKDGHSDADLQSNKNYEKETSRPQSGVLTVNTEEMCNFTAHASSHSTSKLTWSECMDFCDTQMHIISDLRGLKKFINQGLCLRIEEEKVLSWPTASEDIPVAKPSQNGKDKKAGKGKESPVKSGSSKDKSKDKKKKLVPELVHDAPIRRNLGSVHIPLKSLFRGDHKVDIVCDLGVLLIQSEDLRKTIKVDKKKEEKESKPAGRRSTGQNTANSKVSKGKGKKGHEMDAHTDNSVSAELEPVTVEFTVELEKWQSASEVHQHLQPQQTS